MTKIFTNNTELNNIKNVEELLNATGLNWEVEQKEVFLEGNVRIPNTYANVRTDNGTTMGIVTGRYQIVNNKDAFDFINDLTNDITFEDAGEFREGRQVYITADLNKRYIEDINDTVECKIAFTTGHDGKVGVKANILPIIDGKILNLPLKTCKRSFEAIHTNKIEARMANAKNTLALASNYAHQVYKEMKLFNNISVTDKQVQAFAEALFPINNGIGETAYNHAVEKREELVKRVCNNTAYGLIRATADFIENADPQRMTPTYTARKKEKTFQGNALLDKAYRIVKNMI